MLSVRITASILSTPFRQVSRHYLEIFSLFHEKTRNTWCLLFFDARIILKRGSCSPDNVWFRFMVYTWMTFTGSNFKVRQADLNTQRGFQSLLRWLTLVASCQRRALITRGVYFKADLVPRMTWLVCAEEEKERGKRCSGCNSELADCAVCVWMCSVTTASSLGTVGNLRATRSIRTRGCVNPYYCI